MNTKPNKGNDKPVTDVKSTESTNLAQPHEDKGKGAGKRTFRGRQRNRKPRQNAQCDRSHFTNDPAYYKHNPDLLEASAKVAFGLPMGNTLKVQSRNLVRGSSTGSITVEAQPKGQSSLPGILAIELLPSIGSTLDEQDASSVAMKAIYSYVRHANSGNANYDSPDLLIYLLAMREIYAFAGWILRAYASLFYVNPAHRYAPDALLIAQGFDPDDLRAHIPDLKYFLNYFFKQTEALYVPAELPIYRKAFEMFSRVFAEDKTGRSNWYLYRPRDFLMFTATTYQSGGALVSALGDQYSTSPMEGMTFAEIVSLGNKLLAPLLSDEDIGIMSGDIKKAYTSFFTLGSVPADIRFEPVHDSFELQIIHNMTLAHVRGSAPVIQFSNELVQFHTWRVSSGRLNDMTNFTVKPLDIDAEVPSADEIVEATLYKVTAEVINNPEAGSRFHTYASIVYNDDPIDGYSSKVYTHTTDYIPVDSYVYRFASGQLVTSNIPPENYLADSSGTGVNYNIGILLSSFEWFPIGANYSIPGPESNYSLSWPYIGSAHNVTVVSDEVVNRLHSTVMMSLFFVPIPR